MRGPRQNWRADALEIDLLGHLQRVIDVDAKVSHRALELPVPEKKLACAQVTRLLYQRHLGSAENLDLSGPGWESRKHLALPIDWLLSIDVEEGLAGIAKHERRQHGRDGIDAPVLGVATVLILATQNTTVRRRQNPVESSCF